MLFAYIQDLHKCSGLETFASERIPAFQSPILLTLKSLVDFLKLRDEASFWGLEGAELELVLAVVAARCLLTRFRDGFCILPTCVLSW